MACMRIASLSRQLRLCDLPLSIRHLSNAHGAPAKPKTSYTALASLAIGGMAIGVGFHHFIFAPPPPLPPHKPITSDKDTAAAQDAIITAALESAQESKGKITTDQRQPWILDEGMAQIIRRRLIIKARLQSYLETMHKQIIQLQSQAEMLGPKAGPQWFAVREYTT